MDYSTLIKERLLKISPLLGTKTKSI